MKNEKNFKGTFALNTLKNLTTSVDFNIIVNTHPINNKNEISHWISLYVTKKDDKGVKPSCVEYYDPFDHSPSPKMLHTIKAMLKKITFQKVNSK